MKTQTKKVYKSITKGEIGIQEGTRVTKDGRVMYILSVNGEKREVHELTLKRWWKLLPPEHLQEDVEPVVEIEEPKEVPVLTEESTIEDLKQVNEAGQELTEEQLQLLMSPVEPPKKEKKERKTTDSGVLDFFEGTIQEMGGKIKIWSEESKRVVLNKDNKSVMFYWVTRNKTVKICLKEELDSVINCPVEIEVKQSFPKQYPYRLKVEQLSNDSKELLYNILKMHI